MLKSSIDRITKIRSIPIIEGYYLVLGGGKIGTNFAEHARKHSFPFVLILDNDRNAPASLSSELIKDANDLCKLMEDKLKVPLQKESPQIYFYCAGLNEVPFILSFGMPEYIVPAIPCHVAAYIVKKYLNYPEREEIIKEICASPEDKDQVQLFDQFASHFPQDIIANLYPTQGIVMLSYARPGEICPDGCPGPENFCPNFRREKKKTITNYVRDLLPHIKGWVFESYQIKPGIGAMKGMDMKQNLLEISEYVHSPNTRDRKIAVQDITKDVFFIATTCNCHGVANMFQICYQMTEIDANRYNH